MVTPPRKESRPALLIVADTEPDLDRPATRTQAP